MLSDKWPDYPLFVAGTLDRYFKALVNGEVYDLPQRRMPSKTTSFLISAMVEGKDSLGPIRQEKVDGVFRQV